VARNTAKESTRRRKAPAGKAGKESSGRRSSAVSDRGNGVDRSAPDAPRRNGGWREIEALREKAALKASLADVWDEDFDLDEEILADLDHTAEFFTTQEEPEAEEFEGDEEIEEFFEDEDEV
jgi:hypothetical protein